MTLKASPVKYQLIPLAGGLDLVTPTLLLRPGYMVQCQNYEVATAGGYRRTGGYERFDGRAKPSDASYTIVQVASFTNTPTVGQTITQAVSGATGYIIAVGSNYVAVTQVTGSFDTTNAITTPGPVAVGTATLQTTVITSLLSAQYLNLAADVYRALIGNVPGSGSVRGVVGCTFSGTYAVYAFRDNVLGTAVDLYKSSVSGWTQVPLGTQVAFTAGGAPTPVDGQTLTQGGVTATVARVAMRSGAWTGSAAGIFVITGISGGNFAAGAATLSGGAPVTLSGIQTAITLSPGGKFEFDMGNFVGQAASIRLYGCDSVNTAFEFDGTTFVPIPTGATIDTPTHLQVHENHLFLSIASSIFFSATGLPYVWTSAAGAGEIATGDTVTNLLVAPGNQTTGTLVVFCRNHTSMLYGKTAATFTLTQWNTGTGALPYTAQNMAEVYSLDDRGVLSLKTTLAFGNFAGASITQTIKSFLYDKRGLATCSSANHESNQYRLFFSDGYALYLTSVNGKVLGSAPIYHPDPAYCAWDGESSTGVLASYFGAANSGYVYQMDLGSSFDGENIDAFLQLAWDFAGSPRLLKRWRHASVEVQGGAYADFDFGYRLGYGSSDIAQPLPVNYATGFSGAPFWDLFTWDNFVWDGTTLQPSEVDITGTAANIQAMISSSTDYMLPYTLNSVIYHYSLRRGLR